MIRRSALVALTLTALATAGGLASTAYAKEKAVVTKTPYTLEYVEGAEYFGPGNTLHCKGVHKTNSLKYPGAGTRGGEDVEKCTLSKGETFPERWQVVGQPINIDDNFWGSDYDHQEVPFMEELPQYGVIYSKVISNHSFKIKVRYPFP